MMVLLLIKKQDSGFERLSAAKNDRNGTFFQDTKFGNQHLLPEWRTKKLAPILYFYSTYPVNGYAPEFRSVFSRLHSLIVKVLY